MRYFIVTGSLFISAFSFGQRHKFTGNYSSILPKIEVRLNEDSTFEYVTKEMHPTFYRWEDFSEKGIWTVLGDTIILNPKLAKKVFIESKFKEEVTKDSTNLLLTFDHVKRYFDAEGNVVKTDTLQIDQLDYSFNTFKKKDRTRVAIQHTTRCALAGYIPKEIITASHTIFIKRPAENIHNIFIGCNEMQGTKEFIINDTNSTHFTLTVYSNYYLDGQIRQMKLLIKNKKILYTKQKDNGEFEKDSMWMQTYAKLKKKNIGS